MGLARVGVAVIRERVEFVVGAGEVAEARAACDEPGCAAEGPLVVGSRRGVLRSAVEHAEAAGWVQTWQFGRHKAARPYGVRHYCPAHADRHRDAVLP